MGMERDKANEFCPGIAARSGDGNSDLSHDSLYILHYISFTVFIAADIKKGKARSLPFLWCRLLAISVSSTGTAFWRPSDRISFVPSRVSPGSRDLLFLRGRGAAGSTSPTPGRWHVAMHRLVQSVRRHGRSL